MLCENYNFQAKCNNAVLALQTKTSCRTLASENKEGGCDSIVSLSDLSASTHHCQCDSRSNMRSTSHGLLSLAWGRHK